MKLGYFTMPLHPPAKDYRETLFQDRDAAILADQLGFDEAYFGEHSTDAYERITSSLLFIASLANVTKRMKLACGTINLPNGHPALYATQIAMLDHMLEGRFIMGISAGALRSDAELFGTLDQNRNEMFLECINQILELWARNPPYDIEGAYWNISTKRSQDMDLGLGAIPKPFQLPHPEIVCSALAPNSEGVLQATLRGWSIISSNFLRPSGVRSHFDKISEAHERDGSIYKPESWRVVRTIFVTEDEKTVDTYARAQTGPYAFMVQQIHKKLEKAGRLASMFDNGDHLPVTSAPEMLKSLLIAGNPRQVAEQILEFREEAGPFGCLVYAGIDWQDTGLAKTSMELMATEVMPLINRELEGH